MPNWCLTTVVLTGEKKNVKKANTAIKAIMDVPTCYICGTGWLGYLNEFIYPDKYNFDEFLNRLKASTEEDRKALNDERIKSYMHDDCRGWIRDSSMSLEPDENGRWQLQLFIEDAWSPHAYIVSLFALRYNLGFNMMWEEPGMAIYGKFDSDGVFPDCDVVVDYCIPSSLDHSEDGFDEDNSTEHCTVEELNSDEIWPELFNQWRHANNVELTLDNVQSHIDSFMSDLEGLDARFDPSDWWITVNEFEEADYDLDVATEIPDYEAPII